MLKKATLSILLFASALSFSGCILLAAGAAGVGTAKWLSDKISQEVDVPLSKVVKSTKSALESLKVRVYKETTAPDVTQILAKDSDGRQVWVDLRPLTNNQTRIDVRVGYADGENDARKIMERIVSKSKSWI